MTREEAIKKIKKVIEESVIFEDELEAFDMAIQALEKEPCEDCISKQAVLDIIRFEDKWLLDANGHNTDTEIAFNTMKSKVSKLPSVNSQETILDKIRAEIKQLRLHKAEFLTSNNKVCIDSQAVLDILDKYKTESEDI